MSPELYPAIAATILGNAMLFITGINGIRYARLLGLGIDGYAMSGIWLYLAAYGSLNLILTLHRLMTLGQPVAIIFQHGQESYTGLAGREWTNLVVGFAICLGICVRSFIMVANAKRQTAEGRANFGMVHKEMLRLKRKLDV
jgi:hypothetical protein